MNTPSLNPHALTLPKALATLLAGALFGFGLSLATMVQPEVVLGALVWRFALAGGEAQHTSVPAWQLLVGGFLVGYGARLGNGCTSGHGICGLGSLQLPSLGAVLTFMATAFLTANLMAMATKGLA